MSDSANSLAAASSSYLRSAAHQPIQWREWNEAAFALARQEDKPILLDIGAVWCHWCHVMDRESYENPQTAQVINQHFVAIKVDRDERPDVDSRYQAAVQAISGQGGWPLTVFLTPEGKPFFGGTYFPPQDQWGRPGFPRVLLAIAESYRSKRGQVQESAEAAMAALSHAESFTGRSASISSDLPGRMLESALQMFDTEHGGFGSAPKFPHPSALDLVADRFARTADPRLGTLLTTTLEHMARGGVYDQLAGGFHRYSVDARWVVPHFEKMSYDNSELLKNYVHAFQATGNPFFAHVARDIVRWMDAVLSDRAHGGFYASQDADFSLEDDGDYFTWTLDEARAALSEEELQVAAVHYDIGEIGEMHHNPAKNVLYVRASTAEIAARTGLSPARIEELLASACGKLLAARAQRPTPYVDRTIYVSWNALCIFAYLEAARVLSLPEARAFALRSLDRILAQGSDSTGGLRHVVAYSEPASAAPLRPGLLDDYAYTVNACLDAYESTTDLGYFHRARSLADAMIERFFDPTGGGFFDIPAPAFSTDGTLGALTARRKPFQDSPTPAGNPAAVIALVRLHHYTPEAAYRDRAEQTLEVFAGMAEQFGIFGATYGIATLLFTTPNTQVIVFGADAQAEALYRAAAAPLSLNQSVLRLLPGRPLSEQLPPALAQTLAHLPALKDLEGLKDTRSFAIVCSNFTCQPPVYDPAALTETLCPPR